MHISTPAGPCWRTTRRALIAAALPLVAAVVALPSVAEANSVNLFSPGVMGYSHTTNRSTSVITEIKNGDVTVRSSDGIQLVNSPCRRVDAFEASCPGASVQRLSLALGAGHDAFTSRTALQTQVLGFNGDDIYVGAAHPLRNRVEFFGMAGDDHAFYVPAQTGVNVSKNERADDGRAGFDFDNIRGDVERLTGSAQRDTLSGGGGTDRIDGGFGDDALFGNGGSDQFLMGSAADGADRIDGGAGFDAIFYNQRTRPVTVNLSAGGADDGEAGERDEILQVEGANGGSAGDTLKAPPASNFAVDFRGNAGNDTITGTNFDGPCCFTDDRLEGGPGRDTITALAGDDVVIAKDGEPDTVSCGSGFDGITADTGSPSDLMTGCENVIVGKLRLTPKAIAAKAGKPTHVRLSWRHPRAWRKLREIQLHVQRDGSEVGEITIRPRSGKIAADGAVELVRRGTRLARKGKTVTARLALRLDDTLAGDTLALDVLAVDTRGRQQIEPDAGRIRVAR